jgi:hypothetical protein
MSHLYDRRWTLRADNNAHHHGVVNLSESPLYLELWCRESAADKARRIGVFRLDLDRRLQGGYIQRELNGKPGDVRLRIMREATNDFYIQANPRGPKVLLREDEVRGNLAGGEAEA